MNIRRTRRSLLLALVVSGAAFVVAEASAQFCPGGTTYFAGNFSLPSCTVGTCWAANPFSGSTAVTGSQYPNTNYACASTTRPTGAQENTLYTYDNNGNLLNVNDPLDHPTGNIYDALNRLTQVLDPNSGTTRYAYDPANNLAQVTDPRNNPTTYTYNGLNDLTLQVSPDTGTTTSSYDPAGNLLTRIDARGVTATYTYDDINRVTQIVYSKTGTPSETHIFIYDVGANAKGKLTQVTDPVAMTSWTYNSQGRVATKTQQVGSVTLTLTYGYNTAGQLSSITTASGQVIGYGYTNNRISSVTVNGQSLLAGANTTPFGPIAAWRWANGLFTFRGYDRDGRLQTWEFRNGVSLLRKEQGFDNASRITAINDPLNPAANQAYQYDSLDRLTQAQTATPVTHTQRFNYDGVGNRQDATIDSVLTNYTYPTTSNQLQAVGIARTYGYDGAGNPTTITGQTYTYNNANRLVSIQQGATPIASYQVNALGQRVSKTAGATTILFVYDEQGHLLGEYDATGNLIQETAWVEDLPVATVRPTGPGTPPPINAYYVHADHLGSPRAITRPSDNALMWQWDNVDPFGANLCNENPSGQGSFKYALRFPGQYYDAETGTHYNMARDYDPTIGRYLESDPIGLEGGFNSYGYVGQNPLSRIDSDGLFPIPPITIDDPIGLIIGFQRPPKVPGKYACNAKCPTNPTGLSCPQNGCPTVYGYAAAWSLPDAIAGAKSDANDKVPAGCQAKHCTYKCTGPKGDPIYPGPS